MAHIGSAMPTNDHSPPADEDHTTCCHQTDGRNRNLIVCIDGTSNQFGEKNTNVIELYNLILKGDKCNQRTWYNSGIGTYARPSWKSFKFYRQVLYHKIDLAIAWGFERTVLAAYRWLSDNYEPGDCIFLFGFSRGAFQVRVLSGMIDKVGLIYKGNEMQIPFAYELYVDSNSDKPTATRVGSSQTEKKMSCAERFKRAFSYEDVKVHFVGAWDTVSSIGFARGTKMLPRTIEGMKHVCFFRHALALDERRVKFLPEYAYGGSTKPPSPSKIEATGDHPQVVSKFTEKYPHTLEVWFAGTHSDIGGGNVENTGMDRSRPPLRWMVFEAGKLGLRTAPFERELPPSEQIEIKESLTWVWWPLELLFFNRLTYTRREDGKKTTYKPHLGSSRKIHAGQKIHSSLLLAGKLVSDYTPKARPLDDDHLFWDNARTEGLGKCLELDLYEYVHIHVERFLAKPDSTVLQTLRQTATWANGRQAVYEEVINALKKPTLGLEIKYQPLHITLDILRQCPRDETHFKLDRSVEMRPLVSDLLQSGEKHYQEIAQQFLEQCTDPYILTLNGHTTCVSSVAFAPDSRRVVSGSYDRTARIWDAETGKQVGEPFQGHTDPVMSVAFSPGGRRVVSGSGDKTVWIWDAETGKPVEEPFRGHRYSVESVAFSPDGTRVVSGSDDDTVQIWDAETGKQVGEPFRGHTDNVTSVAFSPDGRHVVSGSFDETVRIWDAELGNPVGEPFRGHTDWVRCVAFSPDGRRVVSSSCDKTVRIWDAETGKQVGEPFRGHTSAAMSVAFSPDGRRVVSGSDDKTVRMWDAETGKQVGEPFRGHTERVMSVAFSPDGRCVASGSLDKTVRTWDAESRNQWQE